MTKFSLGTRLFLSHVFVMVVALSSFLLIAKVSSPRFFVLRLEQLERRGFITVRSARTYLVEGFENAWNSSAFWSVLVGATAAGGVSYFASRRIVQPLNQMKDITRKFAAGDWQERMPRSEIPELNQLSLSFNRMARSLEDVEQRRRNLISDMTHELRTPLTVMGGYLEGLLDGTQDASPELYERLVRETKRLERLTYDLQELSKAESGFLTLNPQRMNLFPLVQSLVERFGDQLWEEGPTLQFNCPPETWVWADGDRTEQILVNLLGNAIRYTPQGSITLDVQAESDSVWISVIDTGIGIAPEDLPHIFDRFWRADSSRTHFPGGTGIGLAIAKSLVDLQGGELTVVSQLGQGSRFCFSLPVPTL